MTEKRTTLGEKLTPYLEKEYNSIFNFAVEMKLPTASFNYTVKNNSFRLDKMDIIINHFLSLRSNNNFIADKSPLLQEIENLKKEVAHLQNSLIDNNKLLIDCQQQIINQK